MAFEYIYIIDHARKSIYVAKYQQAINLTENMNAVVKQFVREHLPENLIIPSTLQHEECIASDLGKVMSAGYRFYFIQVSELSQKEIIYNTARVRDFLLKDSIEKNLLLLALKYYRHKKCR